MLEEIRERVLSERFGMECTRNFWAAEPGTNFQDQGTKGVTYTCQLEESLHADDLLPRTNNAVVVLSEWHKKSVNLLNTQGIALKIF